MDKEVWVRVPDYDHLTEEQNKLFTSMYQVSNYGRVWSNLNGIFKIPSTQTKGYQVIHWKIPKNMGVGINGQKGIAYRVHRMVAKAFIENPEDKPDINHIDGDKKNNRIDNIEWCTKVENAKHSRDVLKSACYDKGYKSIYSTLTKEDRDFITTNYKSRDCEHGARPMARKFGVHHKTILKVLKDSECSQQQSYA